jgi:riboflavin biosynthesis pyrimidine reductase
VTAWADRFARFAARKTSEAVAASLPAYRTEIERPEPSHFAVGSEWTTRLFDGPFHLSRPADSQPACSLVFVQSRDGNTGARNPSSLGGGETDKHLIYEGLSRVAADAVLAGASTTREGNLVLSVWHPELVRLREVLGKPRHPIQIVATRGGLNIEDALMFNVPEVPAIVLTTEKGAASMREALDRRPWTSIVVMDRASDLASAFRELRARGVDQISCVGGRHLATQLIDAGLVQDVYLTTAPIPGGDPNTPMYAKPLAGRTVLIKHGTREEAGVRFEHISIGVGPHPHA